MSEISSKIIHKMEFLYLSPIYYNKDFLSISSCCLEKCLKEFLVYE